MPHQTNKLYSLPLVVKYMISIMLLFIVKWVFISLEYSGFFSITLLLFFLFFRKTPHYTCIIWLVFMGTLDDMLILSPVFATPYYLLIIYFLVNILFRHLFVDRYLISFFLCGIMHTVLHSGYLIFYPGTSHYSVEITQHFLHSTAVFIPSAALFYLGAYLYDHRKNER